MCVIEALIRKGQPWDAKDLCGHKSIPGVKTFENSLNLKSMVKRGLPMRLCKNEVVHRKSRRATSKTHESTPALKLRSRFRGALLMSLFCLLLGGGKFAKSMGVITP